MTDKKPRNRDRFSDDFIVSVVPSSEAPEVRAIRGVSPPKVATDEEQYQWVVGKALVETVGRAQALHMQEVAAETNGSFAAFAKSMGVEPDDHEGLIDLIKSLSAILIELHKTEN
jgi:hypothetical protein